MFVFLLSQNTTYAIYFAEIEVEVWRLEEGQNTFELLPTDKYSINNDCQRKENI